MNQAIAGMNSGRNEMGFEQHGMANGGIRRRLGCWEGL